MRKRSRHRPIVPVNPITLAIEGAAITDARLLDQLRIRELSALEAFRTGAATRDDWMAVADILNVAETLAREGVGPEALPACEAVQDALERAQQRFKATGRMGMDGPGLQAIRELADYYDLQRSSISRSQYERAIQRTAARIRSAAPGVKVLV